jgi:tetratricopeptide (TPR) repeat protein
MRVIARRATAAALFGLLLLLGACQSSLEKADAYEARYDRLMAKRAYPAALQSIRQAISYDDTNSRRYIKLAELQTQMGATAGAANAFQAALDLQPDNIEALQSLAMLSVQSGQFDRARRYIEPLLALSANDPAGLLASGLLALGEHRYQDAIGLSDQVIAALPDRAEGYVLKARALYGLGHTDQATDLLEKRAAVAGDPKDILVQLMSFYRRIGDMAGIRKTAIRLMPLFPNDPRYALESARAHTAQGDAQKADRIVADLLRRYAANPGVLVAIADFWRDTLPLAAARAKVVKLAAGSPPPVRSALADQLIDMGDPQDAINLLEPLAPAEVNEANIDSQTHLARALLAAGQVARAQAKVDAVLAYDAGNSEALLTRARIRLGARDYRGAFTDAQLVTNDDETNEAAALLVAQIYVAQGNQLLAAGAFGNLRQKFPHSSNALRAEVDWLLSQKRDEEAAQRASTFFKVHPRSGPAMQIYHDVCAQTHAAACGRGTISVAKMLAL